MDVGRRKRFVWRSGGRSEGAVWAIIELRRVIRRIMKKVMDVRRVGGGGWIGWRSEGIGRDGRRW